MKKVSTMLNTFLSLLMEVINIYYFATATPARADFPMADAEF